MVHCIVKKKKKKILAHYVAQIKHCPVDIDSPSTAVFMKLFFKLCCHCSFITKKNNKKNNKKKILTSLGNKEW